MKRYYFQGHYGCGTWLLTTDTVSTDPFNAALKLAEQGWRNLKLLSVTYPQTCVGAGASRNGAGRELASFGKELSDILGELDRKE